MAGDIGRANHLVLMRVDAALLSIRELVRTVTLKQASRDAMLQTLAKIDAIAKGAMADVNR